MKPLYPLVFFLLFCFLSHAQERDSVMLRSIANQILSNNEAYNNLRILCKEVGPRLTGSLNAEEAIRVTFTMLQRAGADTVYRQPFSVPHWIRGSKEKGEVIREGVKREINITALGGSVSTPKTGLVGPAIEINNFEQLEKLGRNGIAGKIVFFNHPMNPHYVDPAEAYDDASVYRRSGASRAAKYGAIAVVTRSLTFSKDDYPHTGAVKYVDTLPRIPAVAISTNDAAYLSSVLQQPEAVAVSIQTDCKTLPDIISYNIIAELRGSVFPNEIITVGAHLDSWDLAEGAQDDGAGCVQSIEIIRAFRALGIRPKRTIRVVLFMNEENGARGAKTYAAEAVKEGKNFLFALESDNGGFTPRGFNLDMSLEKRNKIMRWKHLFLPYGVYNFAEGDAGTDIEPMKSLGTALAGLSPDLQRYFDVHHSAKDTFEKVNERELQLGAVNMASLVWLISEYGL